MQYSSIGIIALAVLVIDNRDIFTGFFGQEKGGSKRAYIGFIVSVAIYYAADLAWGVIDSLGLRRALYAETVFYFISMAYAVLCWSRYLISYLNHRNRFEVFMRTVGRLFFAAFMIVIAVNLFEPILFWFDENGAFRTGIARHLLLLTQIIMYIMTLAYALWSAIRTVSTIRRRYIAIGLFGLIMAVLLSVQLFNPLLPLYSVGYMLGTCLIHSFVIDDEKEEKSRALAELLTREKRQREELKSAWKLAYTDPMTGAKSKLAYLEAEDKRDEEILDGRAGEFAVAVFDLNDLKAANDKYGHEVGDQLIIDASRIIFDSFRYSDIYRIGGDEFAAIVEGIDYENRAAALERFNAVMEEHAAAGETVVSAGMSEYVPGSDKSFIEVFERADRRMYEHKRILKEKAKQ